MAPLFKMLLSILSYPAITVLGPHGVSTVQEAVRQHEQATSPLVREFDKTCTPVIERYEQQLKTEDSFFSRHISYSSVYAQLEKAIANNEQLAFHANNNAQAFFDILQQKMRSLDTWIVHNTTTDDQPMEEMETTVNTLPSSIVFMKPYALAHTLMRESSRFLDDKAIDLYKDVLEHSATQGKDCAHISDCIYALDNQSPKLVNKLTDKLMADYTESVKKSLHKLLHAETSKYPQSLALIQHLVSPMVESTVTSIFGNEKVTQQLHHDYRLYAAKVNNAARLLKNDGEWNKKLDLLHELLRADLKRAYTRIQSKTLNKDYRVELNKGTTLSAEIEHEITSVVVDRFVAQTLASFDSLRKDATKIYFTYIQRQDSDLASQDPALMFDKHPQHLIRKGKEEEALEAQIRAILPMSRFYEVLADTCAPYLEHLKDVIKTKQKILSAHLFPQPFNDIFWAGKIKKKLSDDYASTLQALQRGATDAETFQKSLFNVYDATATHCKPIEAREWRRFTDFYSYVVRKKTEHQGAHHLQQALSQGFVKKRGRH